MSDCPRCGISIRFAQTTSGARVKIENLPSIRGPDRFREVSYEPLVVEAVDPDAEVSAYPLHDCVAKR